MAATGLGWGVVNHPVRSVIEYFGSGYFREENVLIGSQ
jgi:hypothetical protein